MDLWDRSFHADDRDHPQRRRIRRQNPSFSSSLLDAIYRSIDESNGQKDDAELIIYRETAMKTKQRIAEDDDTVKFRRAFMIEKWMEKKKVRNVRDFTVSSSSSISSESTSTTAGRRFSSSETEFSTRVLNRPKPIKTTGFWNEPEIQKPNHENGFVKTKSKASKKVKPPVSPGGRLANFLNSLFNQKPKRKMGNSSVDYDMSSKSKSSQQGSTTCSSASSFSRSCLSKTASSRGNVKRSVRFCPVSVIVGEDCQPCGHKILKKLEEPIMKKSNETEKLKTEINANRRFDYDDDEEDDGMSCSSSDLFELDNLSVIGIERYREELPVYETTNFKTNCAIAKGLLL